MSCQLYDMETHKNIHLEHCPRPNSCKCNAYLIHNGDLSGHTTSNYIERGKCPYVKDDK